VQSDPELFEVMGIDNGAMSVRALTPSTWTPSPDYTAFCEMIGYELHSQYASYEEWGIQRKLGSKGQSVLRQFYFTHHPWESFTSPRQVESVDLPSLDACNLGGVGSCSVDQGMGAPRYDAIHERPSHGSGYDKRHP
jgi:hypothetical protein